jgi:hypothetical protein
MILVYFQTLEPENSENSDSDLALQGMLPSLDLYQARSQSLKERKTAQVKLLGSDQKIHIL